MPALACFVLCMCACVRVCVRVRFCTAVRGSWEGGTELGCGQYQKCRSIFATTCYEHICSVCLDTGLLPQTGRFIAKAVVFMYYLVTHPLCALSASENLGCFQVAALRDLKRDPVGLGAESASGGLFQERPGLHFH